MSNKYILITAIAIALASCSQDDMPQTGGTPLPDGKYPLAFTASVDGMATRSTGKDEWAEGDKIGVRIGADGATGCYELNHEDGTVKKVHTPVYWQSTAPATVTAWYPYAEGMQTYDISDQSQGYAAFDFLYAETEGSYAAPVQLTFSHQMAKVSYTLVKGQGITDTELDAATVTLLGDKSVTVSGGKITADPTSQTDEIKPCHDVASPSGSAVMVPQNMTGKPLIKVSISGNDFIYTPDTEAAGNLQAGCQHSYTITVKANGIEVTAATGGEWNNGGSEEVEITLTYVIYDGTETEVKTGDYYYADGTWSDGGLRILYADGTMEWAENIPQPVSDKTCIGIVFYTGRHKSDQSDYSKPLTEDGTTIPDGEVHGYVVALTDVQNNDNDHLLWECGPNQEYNQKVGTSTDESNWQGYHNCLKIHEFVNNNAGWEMKHFPAALACETYGKRSLDKDGNTTTDYDWQKPLAAPSNSSGWFLPSLGQLKYLRGNSSLLSPRIDVVKNSLGNEYGYKDKIKWFGRNSYYYWSSTEYWQYSYDAWRVDLYYGYTGSWEKNKAYDVRAVLAF